MYYVYTVHFAILQFDCASSNSELKLYDFAYKRVIVVRAVCSRQI